MVLVNLVSRSDVILLGIPCCVIISSKILLATSSVPASFFRGKNLAALENLSTTTRMPECPAFVKGKSVRKSIAMSFHGAEGIVNGCSSRPGFCVLPLLRWQISHAVICLVTAPYNFGDQNYFFILARLCCTPIWPNLS